MRKLTRWLQSWHKNRSKGKSKGFFNKDDGSIFKAALLSGPPGVGKTTTAQLVCQELGMSYVELNASDSRSKKTLEEVIATSLGNCVLDRYMPGAVKSNSNHVLIMDEVDGMAGSEDRGGIAEMIALIKGTKTPIICICNDRASQKIRSLVNHCFDLRFSRPRVEQIKGAMMSVAYREGLKIPPQAMEQIIVSANQDIRQVLHNLSMWSTTNKLMTYDQAKSDASKAHKDIKLDPFSCIRKVFSMSEGGSMTIFEKSDLFFNDYSLMPLFTQENYLSVTPYAAKGDPKKIMDLISQTADTFCESDRIEKAIRSNGSWSLLPVQAFFSCVIPGDIMRGGMNQRIDFPSWFGKNSKKGKFDRILQELLLHMRLSTSGNKTDLGLDYIYHLRNNLVKPLIAEGDNGVAGVTGVIELMDSYTLNREDWDNLMEVGHFDGRVDPLSKIPTKVKSAFTRTYNKGSHLAHYTLTSAPKKSKRGAAASEAGYGAEEGGEVEDELDNEDDDDVALKSMIKAKKPSKPSAQGNKAKAESKDSKSAKGKGKGKGKSSKN